jgi:hypothetical protein
MTGRQLRSETIDHFTVLGAARGKTAVEIAEERGVNERTVRRRLMRPDIQQRILATRAELLALVRGQLVNLMSESCRTLAQVMASGDDKTRIAAARAVFTAGTSLVPDDDLMAKVAKLQTEVRSLTALVDDLSPEI